MTTDTNSVNWVYTPPVKPVTPKDIYGVENPEIPEGYEITDFQAPQVNDVILTIGGNLHRVFSKKQYGTNPRFILAKLPDQPATAPDGYEFTGEYRKAVKGEYVCFDNTYSYAEKWYPSDPTDDKYWILRPIPTPTLESIYGTDTPVIPEGWESTGVVRKVKLGDTALDGVRHSHVCTWNHTPYEDFYRLILRKKAAPVKSEPKFKVGDWVKGDDAWTVTVGQITCENGQYYQLTGGFLYYPSELTPVAAPPAGFKYVKV